MVDKVAGHRIRFRLTLADQVGAAFHQNAIPVLNESFLNDPNRTPFRYGAAAVRSVNLKLSSLAGSKMNPR
jgi:hypothetical protein